MPRIFKCQSVDPLRNTNLTQIFNSTLVLVIGPYLYLLLAIDNLRFSSRRSYALFAYIIFVCIDYTLYLCYDRYI